MKPVKPPRINGRVPVLSAQEAVNYIPDEATLCVLGAGGGILEATTLITALADKGQPDKYLIAMKYLETMTAITSGENNKVVYMPYEATGILSSVDGIKEMFKGTAK